MIAPELVCRNCRQFAILAGVPTCRQDRRPIAEHVAALTCPLGKFGTPPRCENCHGPHATAACPIPQGFDGDYRRDTGGNLGCNCSE